MVARRVNEDRVLLNAIRKAGRGGYGSAAANGGTVANAYRYPADTEAVAAWALIEGGKVYAQRICRRIPANKATLSFAGPEFDGRFGAAKTAEWVEAKKINLRYSAPVGVVSPTGRTASCRIVGRVWLKGRIAWGTMEGKRAEVKMSARVLRRLCPDGWAVEVSAASQGGQAAPAFREVATGEVYHFPLSYAGRSPVAEARSAFAKRAEARDQAELAAIVERGEAACVFVCASDSYRAGNCRAGTASFAGRHNLDLRRHYQAGELAEVANGDWRLVRAAVVSALRRERRELAAGVCILSDHRAD